MEDDVDDEDVEGGGDHPEEVLSSLSLSFCLIFATKEFP